MVEHSPNRWQTPLGIWRAAHMVATFAIPWALAVYFMRSHTTTIDEDARLVAAFHTKAAIAAAALLVSTVSLRLRGRGVTATIPFALTWAVALGFSVSQIREYSGHYECRDGLCMPDFGLLITAVPFAVVVSVAVVCSAVITTIERRASDHLGGDE